MTAVKGYSYKRAGKTIKVKGHRRGGASTTSTSKGSMRRRMNPAKIKWPIDRKVKWLM